MAQERLQKLLARAGLSSRRKAEELITSGRVRVDGKIVTELGTKADTRAKIEVDGQKISAEQHCYGILHKPRQMMTTLSDPEGRPTIGDILRKIGLRVVPVGRLDFNTSGALLFTNDGDFAQALGHPRSSAPKVYIAKVRGELTEAAVAKFRESIDIDGKKTRPAEVRLLRRENGNTWLEVTLSEGKNRQIRRLGEHADAPVIRLARMSHAGISTDGVRVGEYRLLTSDELQELKTKYGVPKKIRGAITEEELNELPRRRPTTRRTTGSKPKRFVAEGKVARTKRDSFAEGSVDFDADSRAAGRAGSARVGASRGARRADSAPRERSSRATGATSLRATGRSASTSSRGSRGQDFGDREERRGASFARSSSAPGRARSVSEGASRVGGPTRTNATKKPGARSSGPQAGGGRSGSAASPKRGGSQKGTTKPLDRERGSSHRRKTRS